MRRHPSFAFLAILSALVLVLAACQADTGASPSPTEAPTETAAGTEAPTAEPIDFTACEVSDTGGIDDRSFNQNAWEGLQRAEQELGISIKFLESSTEEDYARNIQQFINEGCDLIVTVGFLLGDATKEFAEANPDQRFVIVDFAYDPALPNVEGLVYDTAPAAMMAGYAAASWTRSGVMGTFGGINIGGPVTDFMDGFIAGANYWNEEQGANVRVLGGRNPNDPASGSFTGNFDSTDDAKNLTIGFLQEGADVILPVGDYRVTRWRIRASSASKRRVDVLGEWDWGTFWSGRSDEVRTNLNIKFPPRLQIGLSTDQTFARLPEGSFVVRLFRLETNYSLSPFLNFANLVQYDSESRNLGWQSRVRWTLQPGNDFFFAFNQGWVQELGDDRTWRFGVQDTKLSAKFQYSYRF